MNISFHRWGRAVGWVLALAGSAWILFLLISQWELLQSHLQAMTWEDLGALAISLMLGTFSFYSGVALFVSILRVRSGRKDSFVELAPPFFAGQVIRYLPGRFWGVVYQLGRWQDRYPPETVVGANLDQMQIFLVGNLFWSCALLLWIKNTLWGGLLVFVLGGLVIIFLLRTRWFDRFYFAVAALLGRGGKPQPTQGHWGLPAITRCFGWYGLSWLFYIPVWVFLAHAAPGVEWIDGFRLCAIYTLAWAVGFLAVFTPGGIGVREVVFVLLSAPSENSATASFLAVVMRFWFISADVLCLVVSYHYRKIIRTIQSD